MAKCEDFFIEDDTWAAVQLKSKLFVVTGPKNSGKSCFVGYFLNRIFSETKIKDVCYIEADCGQPNFERLPGSLSLL
jgi:polynucleotide 5'-kinase involved in rRNA processing